MDSVLSHNRFPIARENVLSVNDRSAAAILTAASPKDRERPQSGRTQLPNVFNLAEFRTTADALTLNPKPICYSFTNSHTINTPLPMAVCHHPAPLKLFTPLPPPNPKPIFRCNLSLPSRPVLLIADPEPVYTSVKAFAPATIANLGPGFDFLGDFVSLTVDPQVLPGEISISEISGDHNSKKLSKNPLSNCAGIAAIEVMKMLGVGLSLSLSLHKGLPLGSGLGSSAAAANEIFGGKLGVEELMHAGLKSEEKV